MEGRKESTNRNLEVCEHNSMSYIVINQTISVVSWDLKRPLEAITITPYSLPVHQQQWRHWWRRYTTLSQRQLPTESVHIHWAQIHSKQHTETGRHYNRLANTNKQTWTGNKLYL